jgi:hypothetical protein
MISFRVERKLFDQIEKFANEQGRTKANFVAHQLRMVLGAKGVTWADHEKDDDDCGVIQ